MPRDRLKLKKLKVKTKDIDNNDFKLDNSFENIQDLQFYSSSTKIPKGYAPYLIHYLDDDRILILPENINPNLRYWADRYIKRQLIKQDHLFSFKEVFTICLNNMESKIRDRYITNGKLDMDKVREFCLNNEKLIYNQINNIKDDPITVDYVAKQSTGLEPSKERGRQKTNRLRDLLILVSGARVDYLTKQMIENKNACTLFFSDNDDQKTIEQTCGAMTKKFNFELFELVAYQICSVYDLPKNSSLRFLNLETMEFGK